MFARFTLLTGLLLAIAIGSPTVASANHPVSVVASNWQFTPATITIRVGASTTLHLVSTAGIHGIVSPQLGIPLTTIAPGKPVAVTFVPRKIGTYVLHCAIFCGAGHATMMLTIRVVR